MNKGKHSDYEDNMDDDDNFEEEYLDEEIMDKPNK
jgi:hypothetical protein